MKIITTIFVCALFTLSVYVANAQVQIQFADGKVIPGGQNEWKPEGTILVNLPPEGSVGAGGQNEWKPEGTIHVSLPPEGSVGTGGQNEWKPEGTIHVNLPPEGSVGAGGQNEWKPVGTINAENSKDNTVTFIKTEITSRNSNGCWNAGTPVEWDQDVQQAKAITADVNGVDMLVSRDPTTKEITEYHPLITLQNEIMFQIMKDGHKDWIENLDGETNAIKLWRYLEKKYLNPSAIALTTQSGGTQINIRSQHGKVGLEGQNEGTIYTENSSLLLTFIKTESTSRNSNGCWNPGTPVEWDQDVKKARAVTSGVEGIEMLVSKNPLTKEIIEYHPLITLYNEITFQILKDGHKDLLENLESETNAIKLWQYLEGKYLN